MTYDQNLMADLNVARDRNDDSIDEEVEEEEDSKSTEKLMPPGTFVGSKKCCLGTSRLLVTQNKELETFSRLVQLRKKYGPRVPKCL